MCGLVEGKEQALRRLCETYRVRRLFLFGSAVRPDFDPSRSDLDFLVEFDEPLDGRHAIQYFGLLKGLKALFGKAIDLVEADAIRNPFFRLTVDASKTVLFAA